jgi:hypothetical protein
MVQLNLINIHWRFFRLSTKCQAGKKELSRYDEASAEKGDSSLIIGPAIHGSIIAA